MSQHTPGPWRFHDDRWIEGAEEAPKYRKLIAELPRHRIGSADRVAQVDERNANARLIAKVPEMLTSLQELLRLIDGVSDWTLSSDVKISRARALLREIEGES